MRNLSLQWIAKFNDNTFLHQFNDKGDETKFEEVRKRFSELIQFSLHHKESSFKILVDLKLGLIFINNNLQPEPDIVASKKNIRLIYFRRNKVYLNSSLQKIEEELFYMIGYQYNDERGNNHKIIFQLDSNRNMVLG